VQFLTVEEELVDEEDIVENLRDFLSEVALAAEGDRRL
jgi:hypothetical protein